MPARIAAKVEDTLGLALIQQLRHPWVRLIKVQAVACTLKGTQRGAQSTDQLHGPGIQRKSLG